MQDSLFLKCFIFNIEVNCLVDTGSTICILHPRKYNLLPPNMRPEIKKINTKLCLADGGAINTMGYIDLPIQVGNFTTVQKFTVADIDVPAVIGYDFLHSHKCTLEMGEEVLTLDENQIQCIKESQMSSLFRISLAEKATIPPKAEVIATGKIEGDSSSIINALVQPLQSKHLENMLVHNCTICNPRKQPHRKAKSKMKQYCVGAPMERIALDLIGPLPLSHKGNTYVLIVSDYFTKWVEGYPIPDMETTTIVDNFVTNCVCRLPRQIHRDQGRQFESGLFKELCKKF
jgi:hypothetical protein